MKRNGNNPLRYQLDCQLKKKYNHQLLHLPLLVDRQIKKKFSHILLHLSLLPRNLSQSHHLRDSRHLIEINSNSDRVKKRLSLSNRNASQTVRKIFASIKHHLVYRLSQREVFQYRGGRRHLDLCLTRAISTNRSSSTAISTNQS